MSHPVVVPHGQLQAPVGQVLHAELLPGEGLVPARGGGLPTDPGLLLPTIMTRQQISAIIKLISRLVGHHWTLAGSAGVESGLRFENIFCNLILKVK